MLAYTGIVFYFFKIHLKTFQHVLVETYWLSVYKRALQNIYTIPIVPEARDEVAIDLYFYLGIMWLTGISGYNISTGYHFLYILN